MINRQLKEVFVMRCEETRDEYGTKSYGYEMIRKSKAAIYIYQQSNVEDVRFRDVTHLALTDDKEITDDMRLKTEDGIVYNVMISNNEARRAVLYLKEVREKA